MVDKVLGAKVRIEVNEEGSYEGFVHNIDPKTKKLTLVKVISCTTGTRLHGLHHFFPKEITELTVLEEKVKDKDGDLQRTVKQKETTLIDFEVPEKSIEEQVIPNIIETCGPEKVKDTTINKSWVKQENNFCKKSLQKGKPRRRDPSDEGLSLLQRKPVKHSNFYAEVRADISDDKENYTVNPPDVVIIDSFGELFDQAVAYISRQRVVGVACEGNKVGRFGNLCLIQIGCNKCIYIFDIVVLGDQAFDCGLADIMDSGDILKVIHNCRHLSDALYHQYGVSLVNVFDTQVADVIIYRNETDGELPRQTSSLISTLYEYLDLSPDEYHFHKIRLKHTTNDEYVWKKRPLPKDLIDAIAKTAMYLRELRLSQMERMMEEFIFGVDIYLSCTRDAPDEIVKKKYSPTVLPEMFKKLHKNRERPRYRQLDPDLEGNENLHKAWQEGHNFVEKYEKRGMRVREHKYLPLVPERRGDASVQNDSSSNDLSSATNNLYSNEQLTATRPQQDTHMIPNPAPRVMRNVGVWPAQEGIFSHDDFPHLNSDSDSSGFSPSAAELLSTQVKLAKPNCNIGRGRATALVRNSELPEARLPVGNGRGYLYRSTTAGHIGQLQFPTDEELLNVPEVSASHSTGLPGGARVRISHHN